MAKKPKAKAEQPKRKRVNFEFTPEILQEIEILSGRGLTQEHIFHYYGLLKDYWYDRIKELPELEMALRRGKSKTIAMVTGKLMEQVKSGNMTAIIFWLKTQARWSENPVNPSGGDTEKPVIPALTITVNDPVEASKIYQQIMIGS